jgi:hypothetical protein
MKEESSMDLTKISEIEIDPSTKFLKASPKDLTCMEYTFANGVTVKPVVEPRVVGYTASHPSGTRYNVIELEIAGYPCVRCLVVADENGNGCTGVRLP